MPLPVRRPHLSECISACRKSQPASLRRRPYVRRVLGAARFQEEALVVHIDCAPGLVHLNLSFGDDTDEVPAVGRSGPVSNARQTSHCSSTSSTQPDKPMASTSEAAHSPFNCCAFRDSHAVLPHSPMAPIHMRSFRNLLGIRRGQIRSVSRCICSAFRESRGRIKLIGSILRMRDA